MNKQQFINYIKSPQDLNAETVLTLEKLVKEYPYCQTAESLYTLNLFKEDNFKYNSQLRIASAHVSDRKRLKQHLHAMKHGHELTPDQANNTEIHKAKKSPLNISGEDQVQLIDLISSLKTEVNTIVNNPQFSQKQNLRKLLNKLENIIPVESKTIPVLKPDVKDYNFSHLERKADKENQLQKNRDLIDKFLLKEPKISKVPKSEFFNPDGFAQHSLEDKEDVVSETLAKIYVQQGNFTKAIHIYKKLCLVYPEKSIFFAAQIEKIRKDQIS